MTAAERLEQLATENARAGFANVTVPIAELRAVLKTRLTETPMPRQTPEKPSRLWIIESILQAVAELPDRTSPEGQPDMMLVTAEELGAILDRELTARDAEIAAEAYRAAAKLAWPISVVLADQIADFEKARP